MIKVTFEFETTGAAIAFLSSAGSGVAHAPEQAQPEKPARKPRAAKQAETAAPASVTTESTSTPIVGAAMPPTAQIAPAVDTLAALGLTVETPKPAPAKITQKDLFTQFVALGQKKGPEAIKAILAEYGAATVTALPESKFGEVSTKIAVALQ